MWITTTVSIIAIVLAYISQFKKKGRAFELGFFLLMLIASIQFGYGTDYMRYYELWEVKYSCYDVNEFLANFFNQLDYNEPGWVLLNAIFGFKYGFFVLIALISIVENYIYYRLIKDYVPVKWRWLAVFLYVCLDCLYLLNFSMFRQGFTVALFVAAVMLMNKNKLIPAITIILLSLTIHLSSAICIPFIVLYYISLKKTPKLAVILLLFTLVIFLFKDIVVGVMRLVMISEELGKYSDYGQKTLSGVGIGYILKIIPNLVILYTLFTDKLLKTKEQKVIVLLAFCDILITPLQFYGADFAGRLGVYFIAFKVAAIPIVYGGLPKQGIRPVLILITIFSTLLSYYQFFEIYKEGYTEGYRTIFSVM